MAFFGLTDDFKPTGAFSFEFRNRKTDKEIETITILLPPKNYRIRENFLVNATKTISGVHVDDYGNDMKDISVSGNIHFFYAAQPPNPLKESGPERVLRDLANQAIGAAVDLAQQALPTALLNAIPGLDFLTGLQEMFRLRYIVSRLRDKYPGGKFSKPPLGLRGIERLLALQGYRHKDVKVVYHDWDDNNHFEVVFQSFEITRDSGDVFSFDYAIEMKAVAEVDFDEFIIGDTGTKPKVDTVAENMNNIILGVIEPLDSALDVATDLIDTGTNILNGATALVGEGGIINRMVEQRRNKFYQSIEEIVQQFEEFEIAYGIIDAGLDEQAVGIADLTSPEPTLSSFETQLLIENQQNQIEIANLLYKLLSAYNVIANLQKYLTDTREIQQRLVSNTSQNRVLNSEEFFDDEDDIVANQERTTFQLYEVQGGDNAFNLAFEFFGDFGLYNLILDENDLFLTDFDNNKLAGTFIRIPLADAPPPPDLETNLIYVVRKPFPTQKEKEIETFGTDLALTNDGDLIADGTGDLQMLEGVDALVANIEDRLENDQGSLNEQHPGWGVKDIVGIAGSINNLTILADAIESQANKDPRVQVAVFDRASFRVEADRIFYNLNITPISGRNVTVQKEKAISIGGAQ